MERKGKDAATPLDQATAPRDQATAARDETDAHLGATETDRPGQKGQGNANARAALDPDGLPADEKKICEDVIGANLDKSEG